MDEFPRMDEFQNFVHQIHGFIKLSIKQNIHTTSTGSDKHTENWETSVNWLKQ